DDWRWGRTADRIAAVYRARRIEPGCDIIRKFRSFGAKVGERQCGELDAALDRLAHQRAGDVVRAAEWHALGREVVRELGGDEVPLGDGAAEARDVHVHAAH